MGFVLVLINGNSPIFFENIIFMVKLINPFTFAKPHILTTSF